MPSPPPELQGLSDWRICRYFQGESSQTVLLAGRFAEEASCYSGVHRLAGLRLPCARIARPSGTSSLIFIHIIVLTFSGEVRLIWGDHWTKGRMLYILVCYVSCRCRAAYLHAPQIRYVPYVKLRSMRYNQVISRTAGFKVRIQHVRLRGVRCTT